MKRLCFVAAALLMALSADAKLKLAEVFTDCMVLQCDKPLSVWGTATPGAEVKVKVGRETGKAVAAATGVGASGWPRCGPRARPWPSG